MPMNNEIDALIQAGWQVLESDFNEAAFRHWREEALKCLTLLAGADHPYTHHFKGTVLEAKQRNILASLGVLTAAPLDSSADKRSEQGSDPVVTAPDHGSSRDLHKRETAHYGARDWWIS